MATSGDTRLRPPALLAAALLALSAVVHLRLAAGHDLVGGSVTQGTLFRLQAVAALAAGLWLLLRASTPAWWAAAVVSAGSLAAVVGTVYVAVPALGPFPRVYEPIWYADKVVAAAAVAVALLTAAAELARRRRTR